MGQCNPTEGRPPPTPRVVKIVSNERLREIIENQVRPYEMHLNDGDYGIYSRLTLEEFLQSDSVRYLQLIRGSFDVTNFAFLLIGEERKWFSMNRPGVTSTFGYAVGQIQRDEDDLHMIQVVNCYLNPEGQLWLIDPRDFKLFQPQDGSKIQFIVF